MPRILFLILVAALSLIQARVLALTCHNQTEGYLFDGLVKRGKSNATETVECKVRTAKNGTKLQPSCFEYARRKGLGPLAYGAGCGTRCPTGAGVVCKLCRTDLCNSAIADDIRKKNRVCYTGPFLKGAMTLRRRRKIYCVDAETNCYTISWITQKILTPKYFGGCGYQSCPSPKKGIVCTLSNCTKSLCNSPPTKRRKPCPATGCNAAAATFPGNSGAPQLLLLLLLTLPTLLAIYCVQ